MKHFFFQIFFPKIFFEKLKKKFAVLKCHTNLGNARDVFLNSLRYEGTGRSLSLKLIDQLRKQSATTGGTGVTSKLRKINFSFCSYGERSCQGS